MIGSSGHQKALGPWVSDCPITRFESGADIYIRIVRSVLGKAYTRAREANRHRGSHLLKGRRLPNSCADRRGQPPVKNRWDKNKNQHVYTTSSRNSRVHWAPSASI